MGGRSGSIDLHNADAIPRNKNVQGPPASAARHRVVAEIKLGCEHFLASLAVQVRPAH